MLLSNKQSYLLLFVDATAVYIASPPQTMTNLQITARPIPELI